METQDNEKRPVKTIIIITILSNNTYNAVHYFYRKSLEWCCFHSVPRQQRCPENSFQPKEEQFQKYSCPLDTDRHSYPSSRLSVCTSSSYDNFEGNQEIGSKWSFRMKSLRNSCQLLDRIRRQTKKKKRRRRVQRKFMSESWKQRKRLSR